MIQGPNYLYVEIPRTGSTYVSNILIEQCEGFRITPRHDPLKEKVELPTFTVVRNPYTRMPSLWHYMDEDRSTGFIEWFEWVSKRDTGIYVDQPQAFWKQNVQTFLKMEELEEKFPKFMKTFGWSIEAPPFEETVYSLEKEEYEFIRDKFNKDFVTFNYSRDRRKKY